MSGPLGSSQWMYSRGSGFYPYEIGQSLRFNDNDSAYLATTVSTASSTYTLSLWLKRGVIASSDYQYIFSSGVAGLAIGSTAGNTDKFYTFNGATITATPSVYRDPSAWYHLLLSVASNTGTLYVNGESVLTGAPCASLSTTANATRLGHYGGGGAFYFDGYMAEVNFVDGTALDPTSFGESKSGVWVPKAYAGSYGTNGFYLSFADSAAIGDDLSGNGNDLTPSGLASTDVLLDSPTNNYCTLNPLLGTVLTFSNGNLNVVSNNTNESTTTGTLGFPQSGKYYYEAKIGGVSGGSPSVGIASISKNTTGYLHPKQACIRPVTGNASRPEWVIDGVDRQYDQISSTPLAANDIIQVIYDADNGKVWFGINDTYYGVNSGASTTVSASDIASGVNPAYVVDADYIYTPCVIAYSSTEVVEVNFGQSPFTYTPPADFLPLNTANLPEPTITPALDDVPADYFNTVLYTGTGAAQSITGVGFQPDWLWIKNRSATGSHHLYDAQRGAALALFSSATAAENSRPNSLTSFDTDGFTVGTSSDGNTNLSANSYVAWNWKANGAGVSNTDGTITSTVSVNQKAGFSIVTYTGTGSAATIGHGLGVAPAMVIVKNRDNGAVSWVVYHKGVDATNPENYMLFLNLTNARSSSSATGWNSTAPTSSVFSVNNYNSNNQSGSGMVAYCFAEVEGFSKFGSYTGNGSANGPFVYCGFRPAFVMIKRTDGTAGWIVFDSARDSYNLVQRYLVASSSGVEGTGVSTFDFVSNGVKLRSTFGDSNASGGTYIFAAFAESPFKYSNAR